MNRPCPFCARFTRAFTLAFALGLLLAKTTAQNEAAVFRFAEATIDSLQAEMASGRLTARELTSAYLERIAEIDRAGPRLNAVIELNPDALAIAYDLDHERRSGSLRGPLHGIPVLIKDNIATADKMETTAGSFALVGQKPQRDAHLVSRLRAAGAVILGKTNLSEWANFRGARSISGWSARGGQTQNPYALDRSPSGSSSGSAVAVAANLCVVAVGTETNGSIIAPASINGVVGLKPTLGAVSRTGVIPIAATYDTAGALARTVHDAALLLSALAGRDDLDTPTTTQPEQLARTWAASPPRGTLKGARLGFVHVNVRPNLDDKLKGALDALRSAGAEVIEVGEFPGLSELGSAGTEVMLYEMKAGLNDYLAGLAPGSKIKSLKDLIVYNDAHWSREQPLFGQQYFAQAQAKGLLTDAVYTEALGISARLSRTDGIDRLMNLHRLDALVALANSPAGLITPPESGDPLFGPRGPSGSGYTPPARAGYPSITVPMADVSGLPVGLLFYGRPWTETTLLAFAAEFEALTHARRTPHFLPTATIP